MLSDELLTCLLLPRLKCGICCLRWGHHLGLLALGDQPSPLAACRMASVQRPYPLLKTILNLSCGKEDSPVAPLLLPLRQPLPLPSQVLLLPSLLLPSLLLLPPLLLLLLPLVVVVAVVELTFPLPAWPPWPRQTLCATSLSRPPFLPSPTAPPPRHIHHCWLPQWQLRQYPQHVLRPLPLVAPLPTTMTLPPRGNAPVEAAPRGTMLRRHQPRLPGQGLRPCCSPPLLPGLILLRAVWGRMRPQRRQGPLSALTS